MAEKLLLFLNILLAKIGVSIDVMFLKAFIRNRVTMIKIRFSIPLLIIVLTGCASSGTTVSKKPEIPTLKSLLGYASDCNRGKGESELFCSCSQWASDKTGKIEFPQDKNATEDEIVGNLANQMIKYFDRLDACEIYAPITLDIEIPKNSDLLESVLSKYQENIATPENSKSLSPIDKKVGWKYKMGHPNGESINLDTSVFVYKGREGDDENFDYVGSTSTSKRIYRNGRKYFEKNGSFVLTRQEECKFVLGECIYKVGDKKNKMYTEFRGGVWIRNVDAAGIRNRGLERIVYDSSGIPVYRAYDSGYRGVSYERVRYEGY